MNRILLLILIVFGSSLVHSSAATILYEHHFTGSSADSLNGVTPDTTINTNVWTANSAWRADGSVSTGDTARGAFLPFSPQGGLIYTLEATLISAGTGNTWLGVGFTGNDGVSASFQSQNASPWVLHRGPGSSPANGVSSFLGPGTSGSETNTPTGGGPQTFRLVLNTTSALWTTEWFLGASETPFRTEVFMTNPTINYVGIGYNRSGTDLPGSASHFSLSVIPEPSSGILVGIALFMFLGVRRSVQSV